MVTEFVNGGSVEMAVSSKHSKSIRNNLSIGDLVQMFIDAAKGIGYVSILSLFIKRYNNINRNLSFAYSKYHTS